MDYPAMEQYWIWLWSVEGMTVKRFCQLLEYFGDPRAVWDNAGDAMPFLGEKLRQAIRSCRRESYLYALFAKLKKLGLRCRTLISEDYPPLLLSIADPPPVLYTLGQGDIPREKTVAVVGSRGASRDGRRAALEIGEGLGREGVTVVSGLARGVDSCAHEGCLNGGGRTVAVLGCGADLCYPPENGRLRERILQMGGLLISEYAPGVPPLAAHFPARNRILSGLSEGVLIVEGAKNSGARITADLALEQGREVFAVPGSIYSELSFVPNRLIQDGAGLVLSHWDLIESFRWGERPSPGTARSAAAVELDGDEKLLVEMLRIEELSFDELAARSHFNSARLNSLLTILELRGIIRQAPGRMYRA